MRIHNDIINGDIIIENIEEGQKQFKPNLNKITTGNPKHKSENQLDTIKNIKYLYD